MSERKPGFTYIYSEVLKQEIAYSRKTGKVYCADGTQYTMEEIEWIKKSYGEIPLEVHILKKHFGGTIIKAEDKRNEKH